MPVEVLSTGSSVKIENCVDSSVAVLKEITVSGVATRADNGGRTSLTTRSIHLKPLSLIT